MSKDNLRNILWMVILTACLVLFLFLINSGIMAGLVNLVIQTAVLIRQLFLAVDQKIFWILLVVICGLISISVLPAEQLSKRGKLQSHEYLPEHPVERWQSDIDGAFLFPFDADPLNSKLEKLLLEDTTGSSEKLSLTENSRQIDAGLDEALNTIKKFSWLEHIMNRKKYHNSVAAVIEFMEKELEIVNDE